MTGAWDRDLVLTCEHCAAKMQMESWRWLRRTNWSAAGAVSRRPALADGPAL